MGVGILQAVNHFQRACIDPLANVTGKRLLRDYVRFEPDEFQGKADRAIAAKMCYRRLSGLDAPCLRLVYRGADVHVLSGAEYHEWLGQRPDLRVLAETNFVLQDGSIDRRADREPLDVDFVLMHRGGCLFHVGLRNRDVGAPTTGFQ